MRVLTYNIAGARGRPGHLRHVADLVRQVDADVVGLQEVVHGPNGEGPPPEETLAGLLGMHVWFLPAHEKKGRILGNAVLCKEPIQATVSHELPVRFPERRVLLEVDTSWRGMPVTVFCTHLVHLARVARRVRLAQATAVAQQMARCPYPHLLLGDLNTGPAARELHPVRSWCGSWTHLLGKRSWPARRPMIMYDHIWPGPGWKVESLEILDRHLSDHRPVLARLTWRPAYEEAARWERTVVAAR